MYNGPRDGLIHDEEMIEKAEIVLPELAKNYFTNKRHFALLLGFEDTHPNFCVHRCTPRKEMSGNNKIAQAFDCVDQRIERLMTMIHKLGLNSSNTEIIIHGDHPIRGRWPRFVDYDRPRPMFMLFPHQKAKRLNHTVSLYDITPTLYDLMNIKYRPEFPFGSTAMKPKVTKDPTDNEKAYIVALVKMS